MEKSRTVFWEKRAEQRLDRTLSYLLDEWYLAVAEGFYFRIKETVATLSIQPELGTRVRNTASSYSFPVSYYRLVYFFNDQKIIITDIVDMRSGEALKNE